MRLLDSSKYIGEIGLDYSEKSAQRRDFQKRSFEKIVLFCSEKNKLMSVHIKKAEGDAIEIISKHSPIGVSSIGFRVIKLSFSSLLAVIFQ